MFFISCHSDFTFLNFKLAQQLKSCLARHNNNNDNLDDTLSGSHITNLKNINLNKINISQRLIRRTYIIILGVQAWYIPVEGTRYM